MMHASRQASTQALWLTLLVAVLLVSMTSPVCWLESQQQEIALESDHTSELPKDDAPVNRLRSMLLASGSLKLSPASPAIQSPCDSSAYPCNAVHGPPATDYPV
jgi:hypothetical protein